MLIGPNIDGIHLGMTVVELKDVGFRLGFKLIEKKLFQKNPTIFFKKRIDDTKSYAEKYVARFDLLNDRVMRFELRMTSYLFGHKEMLEHEFVDRFTNKYLPNCEFKQTNDEWRLEYTDKDWKVAMDFRFQIFEFCYLHNHFLSLE